MRLDDSDGWARLGEAGHGVLGTVHAARGVDAVPVVFIVDGHHLVIPIDTVKPKAGGQLQRLRNLYADDRAVLLVDHYQEDWTRLWWVRVHAHAHEAVPTSSQRAALARAFPAYAAEGTVPSVIVLVPDEVTGWTADPSSA